jgi:glutathione S-transferase
MTPPLILVSHALCPYVQRVAIALAEKRLPFERVTIDLADKPDWFKAISPLGKVPLLRIRGDTSDHVLFESAALCEYLEDVAAPALHPADAIERARHRAWMEFGSGVLGLIANFYSAPDERSLEAQRAAIRARFETLEAEVASSPGPWFSGDRFTLVDAVFGPVFRYFDVMDPLGDFGFFDGLPHLSAWRVALAARPSVRDAVDRAYPALLREFIDRRGGALSRALRVMEAQHASMATS